MSSEEELVASIKAKMPDFAISVAALKNPTSKFVHSYYVRLLEELGADFPDSVDEVATSDDQGISNSMRHMMPLFKLAAIMSKFCEEIYVHDFSLDDITEPRPRRTLYLMRALDIYHTFADWKAQLIDAKVEAVYNRKEDMDKLKMAKDELQEKLNVRTMERAQDGIQINQRQDLVQMRTTLLEEITQLDLEVERGGDFLNSEKQQLQCLKEELEKLNCEWTRLQSQVVSSPARLEKELQELRLKVADSKSEYQQLLQNRKDKCQLKDAYKRNIVLQDKCQGVLKDVLSTCESSSKLASKLEDLRRNKAMKYQEVKDKNDKVRSKTKKMQEQLETLRVEHDRKTAEMLQAIAAEESKVASLRKKRDEEQKQSEQVQAEKQELEAKFELLLEVNRNQNKQFQEMYDKRVAEQDAFLDKCEEKMKKFMEEMKRSV